MYRDRGEVTKLKKLRRKNWGGGGSNGLGPPPRTIFYLIVYLILGISDYLSQITTEIRIKYLNCVFVRSEKNSSISMQLFWAKLPISLVYVKIRFILYCSRSANRSIQII